MRPGRRKWIDDVTPDLRKRIEEALLASPAAPESAIEIHRRLSLGRYCTPRTFDAFARARRKEAARRREPAPKAAIQLSGDATPAQVLQASLNALAEQIAAGLVRPSVLPLAVQAVRGLQELEIKRCAEARAAEVHESKMRVLRKALDAKSEDGAKTLTREDVYDLVDQVMRGAA